MRPRRAVRLIERIVRFAEGESPPRALVAAAGAVRYCERADALAHGVTPLGQGLLDALAARTGTDGPEPVGLETLAGRLGVNAATLRLQENEPFLLRRGWVEVVPGGRRITRAGLEVWRELRGGAS